jgi:hypothetical protein
MREILKDVFTWSWYSEPHGYDFNGYLIRSEDGNLAIDPVSMSDEVLEAITALGIARILITNRNHTRAANRLRAATSAPTAIHESDAGYERPRVRSSTAPSSRASGSGRSMSSPFRANHPERWRSTGQCAASSSSGTLSSAIRRDISACYAKR